MPPMLAEQIADYLEARGVGTVWDGTTGDIFIEVLPEGKSDTILITSTSGEEGHRYLDTLYDGLVFFTRSKDPDTAYKTLAKIRNVLHRGQNYDLPDFHIYFSHMNGPISALDRDAEDAMLYSLGINFIFRDINVAS